MREIDTAVVRDLTRDLVAIPSVLRPGTTYNGIAGDASDVLKMILRDAVRDVVLVAMPDVATPQRKSVRHDQDDAPEDDVATPVQVEALHAAIPQPWSIAAGRSSGSSAAKSCGTATARRRRCTCVVRRTGTLTDLKSEMGVRSMAVPPLMIHRLREQIDESVGSAPSSSIIPMRAKGSVHTSALRENSIWADS